MSEKTSFICNSFTCTCGGTMRGTSFIRLTGLPHSEYKNGKFFDYHIDNYEGEQYFCDKCGQIKEVRFLTIEYSNKDRQSTQGEKL